MAIVRYNPTGFGELQKEINRLFNVWDDNESSGATAGWIPSVEIQEEADRFQLFVDLPGVDPKDVDITLDGGVLTVSGERSGQGRLYRRFALPETVDSENVKATGRDGVLEITIPKHAKAQPRRIEVVS
jgi:HSP20 family protein